MTINTDQDPEFNLVEFASAVKNSSDVPTYAELIRDKKPEFLKFLSGLRDRLREIRASGKKIILVLGTGGTFQSAETDAGRAPTGTLKESFDALGLPEDPSIYLELCDLMNLDSSQMNVDHWRFLAEMIIEVENEVSDLYDAIIVTHGTDTMTKGASYLSFMLKGFPKSIIFTGSQEPARKSDSDAKDQMARSIITAKLTSVTHRKISEVMVCCGLKVSRGTWATKLGDKTVDAFGPWNDHNTRFDPIDFGKAVKDGTAFKMAPALLEFGTSKSTGSLEFASHAIDFEHKGQFDPFTNISNPANIFPATLSDKSPSALAYHIRNQRVSILKQLGSATADDALVEVALKAGSLGKIILFEAPFHDSSVTPGTYKAGSKVKNTLPNIQRSLPILNTSPSTFEAKPNYLLHRYNIQPIYNTNGLGDVYSSSDLRRFYDNMEQNFVGEMV